MQCADLFGLERWALQENLSVCMCTHIGVYISLCPLYLLNYLYIYSHIFAYVYMCGEQKSPDRTELMRKYVPVSYNFIVGYRKSSKPQLAG